MRTVLSDTVSLSCVSHPSVSVIAEKALIAAISVMKSSWLNYCTMKEFVSLAIAGASSHTVRQVKIS